VRIVPVTVSDVEYVAFRLARERLSSSESIPDFSTRYPDVLESCVATPFQSFSGKGLYPSLVAKASILFYLMIKNHPFQNGNKRLAITTLFLFLQQNGKWLRADIQELYNFTVWIAQSPSGSKDQGIDAIQKFIREHLVSI
jgi:death on curing protein